MILEILQLRISGPGTSGFQQELIRQIRLHNQKSKDLTIEIFHHETIKNHICLCIRDDRSDDVSDPASGLGIHLASCLKPFGDISLSRWIESSFN